MANCVVLRIINLLYSANHGCVKLKAIQSSNLSNQFCMENLTTYSISQLALRNGQDMDEIWVAYNGIIYDVSISRLWRNGKHYEHWAGQDLTAELADAPHNDMVFSKFKAVGLLKK